MSQEQTTKENQAGEISYRIEALDEQTAEFAEYAATTNYWRCRTDNPRFPVSDSLEPGTVNSWSTLTLDAVTGYVMFQIEDTTKDSMALTVVHADYQDFNGWTDAYKQDGKGLFHRSAKANTVIKFSHQIEPRPGYMFSASSKPFDGELRDAYFIFRPEEAVWFSTALEAAMGVLVFGVPSASSPLENPF